MRRRGSFSHRINSGSAGPAARPACPGGTRSAPRGLCLLFPGDGLAGVPRRGSAALGHVWLSQGGNFCRDLLSGKAGAGAGDGAGQG